MFLLNQLHFSICSNSGLFLSGGGVVTSNLLTVYNTRIINKNIKTEAVFTKTEVNYKWNIYFFQSSLLYIKYMSNTVIIMLDFITISSEPMFFYKGWLSH